MPVLVHVQVEVYPEYIDAELMVFEKLRALYGSQPGCHTVRLLKDFDDPTTFYLCTTWDDQESAEASTRAWAESEVMPEALSVVATTPSRQIYRVHHPIGNPLATLRPRTIVVVAHDMAAPGMAVEKLDRLGRISDRLAVEPGFLGALGLDDLTVEEHVAIMQFWLDYRSFRRNLDALASRRLTTMELIA
jgi:quinol monooxygenase YgiN